MNKARRKSLEEIAVKLADIMDELDSLTAEEQEAYDNMPESLQDSEKCALMQEAIENMEEALHRILERLDNQTEIRRDGS